MAIQTRRGPEKDFDPNKLLPGEFAGTTDTKRIFYAFAAGETKEMATYEDMQQEIKNATGDIVAELTDGVETAITNTNKATESANQAAIDANTAKEAADTAAYKASNAASEAREAAEAALSKGVSGVKGDKEVNFRTGNVNLTSENIGAVKIGGDVAENTVAFTSNDSGPDGEYAILSVDKLTTGEKFSSLMQKISRMFTNMRYVLWLLGNNDITSESVKIGDGTVTGAIRTLNDNLSMKNITSHLTMENETWKLMYAYRIGNIGFVKFRLEKNNTIGRSIVNIATVDYTEIIGISTSYYHSSYNDTFVVNPRINTKTLSIHRSNASTTVTTLEDALEVLYCFSIID